MNGDVINLSELSLIYKEKNNEIMPMRIEMQKLLDKYNLNSMLVAKRCGLTFQEFYNWVSSGEQLSEEKLNVVRKVINSYSF
jgi:hypothetical protein